MFSTNSSTSTARFRHVAGCGPVITWPKARRHVCRRVFCVKKYRSRKPKHPRYGYYVECAKRALRGTLVGLLARLPRYSDACIAR